MYFFIYSVFLPNRIIDTLSYWLVFLNYWINHCCVCHFICSVSLVGTGANEDTLALVSFQCNQTNRQTTCTRSEHQTWQNFAWHEILRAPNLICGEKCIVLIPGLCCDIIVGSYMASLLYYNKCPPPPRTRKSAVTSVHLCSSSQFCLPALRTCGGHHSRNVRFILPCFKN